LPPIFIQVGSAEVLLDDALRLPDVAAKDEVEVFLEVIPEMIHVGPNYFPLIPEGREAIKRGGILLNQKL
jgi:monoterpene epsilon-lactone hydrolase